MAKRKAAQADDDLTPPSFLVRKALRRLTNEEARDLANPAVREWVMPRDHSKDPPKPPDPIYVYNDAASVQVNVRQKKGAPLGLATYADMAEFNAKHDRTMYPVVQTASDKENTIILCSAKPWAPKPGEPVTVDTPPPTKRAASKKGDQWADSILAACREGAMRAAVIEFLTRAYPGTPEQEFQNIMYGTLERMVAAGALTKAKGPGGVAYTAGR